MLITTAVASRDMTVEGATATMTVFDMNPGTGLVMEVVIGR
jgi:hypothetical protein